MSDAVAETSPPWIVRRGRSDAWQYVWKAASPAVVWTDHEAAAMRFDSKASALTVAERIAAGGVEVAVFSPEPATPAIGRFVCSFTSLEAIRFDGTRASALAIAAAFPGRIGRDVAQDNVLLALSRDTLLGREELRPVPPGSWLVARYGRQGPLDLFGDRHFRALHEPDPRSPA